MENFNADGQDIKFIEYLKMYLDRRISIHLARWVYGYPANLVLHRIFASSLPSYSALEYFYTRRCFMENFNADGQDIKFTGYLEIYLNRRISIR